MRNVFLFLLLLPLCLQAQLSKGDAKIGGSLEIFNQPNAILGLGSPLNISVGPAYGRFISDHLLVGGSLGVYTSILKNNHLLGLSLRPYGRYYFKPKQENNFIYGEIAGTFSSLLYSSQDIPNNARFDLSLGVGLDRFVAPGVSVNFASNIIHGFTPNRTDVVVQVGMSAFLQSTESSEAPITSQVLQAGNLIVGGSSLYFNRSIDEPSWSLSLSPGMGYFVTDHWVAGADITLSASVSKFIFSAFPGLPSEEEVFISNHLTLHTYTRYYVAERARFAPYLGAGFTYQNRRSGIRNKLSLTTGFFMDLVIGVDYFLTKNLALEGGLTFSNGFEYRENTLQLQAAVQFFFLR